MIEPLVTRLVTPEWAREVVSPASDAMNDAQRHEFMDNHPYSFLHVTRPSPADQESEATPNEIVANNRSSLERILAADAYGPKETGMWVYQIQSHGHRQSALIADVELAGYDNGQIRPHERTRTDREDQLALHLKTVGANGSPVGMTHRPNPEVSRLIAGSQRAEPVLDFIGLGGLEQKVWQLDEQTQEAAKEVLDVMPLYVTDGHHRLAAALRHRDDIERTNPGSAGPQHRLLAAIYPPEQLATVAFHRLLSDVSFTTDEVVDALGAVAAVNEVDNDQMATPRHPGHYGMYHGGRWFVFVPLHQEGLDVTWMQDKVLDECFGVRSARTDPRLSHVPATTGIEEVVERSDRLNGVAFLMAATSPDAIMDAADAKTELPPKSSFFTPKPRSGIFLVSREPSP